MSVRGSAPESYWPRHTCHSWHLPFMCSWKVGRGSLLGTWIVHGTINTPASQAPVVRRRSRNIMQECRLPCVAISPHCYYLTGSAFYLPSCFSPSIKHQSGEHPSSLRVGHVCFISVRLWFMWKCLLSMSSNNRFGHVSV